ncbi:alpha/beta hydrolase [Corynebacterium sanguinis]|uniref:alpha/beta hydrolase n=1 Tax=Corynebacterium sanguinis TaxID=2594913 RepID=UPI00223AB181|nr:alpha/beta hydrolase [Corynebacterium sanguinis]MCT1555108.1 alpha/beta hydrolase [Corynebacterium sanguinis]MCT1613471.1 alpha/beta hydrolase [Corynebacterium sanguinis]
MIAPTHGARGTGAIDNSAEDVARTVLELPDTVTRVDIVGHSSGGLIALRSLDDERVRQRVSTLVGLGAAWRGTDHRAWYRPDWLVGHILGQSFTELEDVGEPVVPRGVDIVSLVSDADSVVPASSARLGRVVEISGVPHTQLPGCTTEVLRALGL